MREHLAVAPDLSGYMNRANTIIPRTNARSVPNPEVHGKGVSLAIGQSGQSLRNSFWKTTVAITSEVEKIITVGGSELIDVRILEYRAFPSSDVLVGERSGSGKQLPSTIPSECAGKSLKAWV